MTFRNLACAAVAAALLLAGCAGDAPPVTEQADLPVAEPEKTVTGSITIPALSEERSAAARQAPAPEPEIPVPALDSLAGVGEAKVTALLGAPHFRRVDAPAELWQYRVNGCVLDLFLYPASGGSLSVDHLETRIVDGAKASGAETPQACFAAMVRAARGTSS